MSEEIESMRVNSDEILEGPTADTEDLIGLLLEKDDVESIKPEKDLKKLPKPDFRPVTKGPSLTPEECTSPDKILSVSMVKNGALAQFLGNPTENDPLVDAVRRQTSTTNILNVLMEEMAEEAAFIKAWRNQNWNGEVDLSEATSKRIKMLKDIVETLVEKEKLKKEKSVGKVDFHGDNFQRVLKHFLEIIQSTFKKVAIPAQFEDIFFTQLAKEFDGFEKAAEKIYYGKE